MDNLEAVLSCLLKCLSRSRAAASARTRKRLPEISRFSPRSTLWDSNALLIRSYFYIHTLSPSIPPTMAQSRLQSVVDHLRGATAATSSGLARLQVKNPDDGRQAVALDFQCTRDHSNTPCPLAVVVTAAFRTPLCKARKGGYKDTSSDELLLELFKAAKANIGIDAGLVGDMCVVLSSLQLHAVSFD